MGFFSAVKKMFKSDKAESTAGGLAEQNIPAASSESSADTGDISADIPAETSAYSADREPGRSSESLPSSSGMDAAELPESVTPSTSRGSSAENLLLTALRAAEPRLSVWLAVVLDGVPGVSAVDEAGDMLWQRLSFLLNALETPGAEAAAFISEFKDWLNRMDYRYLEDFRSELQYRLALALDMEDEEDERDRLFLKVQAGLAKTRARFGQGLAALVSSHSSLSDSFWEELEELFIMSDMGAEPAIRLVGKLRDRARQNHVETPQELLPLLQSEVEALFKTPKRIAAINPPEVILMVGVNGVGKTTTIAKLAYRAKMQGKSVLIAGADTFRAAAVEQLQVWAERVGADFHSKGAGADPAAVAYEAMDKAVNGNYDVVFIDTAGRLHTKSNLLDELTKIRNVITKKHQGAPHRTILVIDATTGQNALQQTKIFKESSGVDEVILTKLDGTAKGGVALAVASQFEVPITFIGLGEKMEDLRPFSAHDFAQALFQKEQGE